MKNIKKPFDKYLLYQESVQSAEGENPDTFPEWIFKIDNKKRKK